MRIMPVRWPFSSLIRKGLRRFEQRKPGTFVGHRGELVALVTPLRQFEVPGVGPLNCKGLTATCLKSLQGDRNQMQTLRHRYFGRGMIVGGCLMAIVHFSGVSRDYCVEEDFWFDNEQGWSRAWMIDEVLPLNPPCRWPFNCPQNKRRLGVDDPVAEWAWLRDSPGLTHRDLYEMWARRCE